MQSKHSWADICLALTLMLTTMGCNPDAVVSNKYCNIRARFVTDMPVTSISPLYGACNSPNEWCTVTITPTQIIFANTLGSQPVSRTRMGNLSILVGISGFIVGQPPIFEMGYETSNVTCFELACSNCFEHLTEKHPLTLKPNGKALCSHCHRTYDLNNLGVVHTGDRGIPLYRYKVYYSNNTLRIDN